MCTHTHTHTLTMYMVLLKALAWSKVDVSCHFTYFNISFDVTTFIDLFLYLVCPAIPHTLFNPTGTGQGPPLPPVRLSYLLTSVATWHISGLSSITTVNKDEWLTPGDQPTLSSQRATNLPQVSFSSFFTAFTSFSFSAPSPSSCSWYCSGSSLMG